MKGLKKALAVCTLFFALLLAFYFKSTSDNRLEAGTTNNIEAAGEELTETDPDVRVSTVMQVQTIQTEEDTSEVISTENITQQSVEIQQTTQVTEEPTVAKSTEVVVTNTVQSSTQPATQVQESKAPDRADDKFTNIVYKDAYNTYRYSNLDEARQNININILTDEEAKAIGLANKSKYAKEAETVLNMINDYRASLGLSRLTYNDTLATVAMHRAEESAYANWNMTAIENGVAKRHIRPNLQKASTIFTYYGLSGNFGENYGRFQTTPAEILQGWQESKSHNELMTSAIYSQLGIGVAQDSDGYYYWIALFM